MGSVGDTCSIFLQQHFATDLAYDVEQIRMYLPKEGKDNGK